MLCAAQKITPPAEEKRVVQVTNFLRGACNTKNSVVSVLLEQLVQS